MYHLCFGVVNLFKSSVALVYLRPIFLYFFTNLNWNKCWLIPIFCHRCGKHLDVTISVRRCCCGLYFQGTFSKILTYFRSSIPNEQFLWSFATFSIGWVSKEASHRSFASYDVPKMVHSQIESRGASWDVTYDSPKRSPIFESVMYIHFIQWTFTKNQSFVLITLWSNTVCDTRDILKHSLSIMSNTKKHI